MNIKPLSKFVAIFLAVFAIVLLLIINKSRPTTEHERITQVRKDAFAYAIECSNTKNIPVQFDEITWVVMPGSVMIFHAMDGDAKLVGWTDPEEKAIYIVETEKDTFWIIAHESLHMLGYIGHPDFPFKTCGVLATQN